MTTTIDVSKYKNLANVTKLIPTRNPTEVLTFLKNVVTALQADGISSRATRCIDPRTKPPFKPFEPPSFNPATDGLSEEVSAYLNEDQREAAKIANATKFEDHRRKLKMESIEQMKQIYSLVKSTLSPDSIAKVKAIDASKYDDADIDQDTQYLIKAIIISHSGASSTGLSQFAIQDLLSKRVLEYLSCVQGKSTLGEYLDKMNDHIQAIKSMDENVSEDCTGGYLGSKTDQVSRFLRGTGATRIINLHLNGELAESKIPRTFEEVVTLITNWHGPIHEQGPPSQHQPQASIMTMSETTERRPNPGSRQRGRVSQSPPSQAATVAELATKEEKDNANAAAIARGVIVLPPSEWKGNPGSPNPPLIRTTDPTMDRDKRCSNCGGYHPSEGRRTYWVKCPKQWDAVHVERDQKYQAILQDRRKRGVTGANRPAGTIALSNHTGSTRPTSVFHYTAEEHAATLSACISPQPSHPPSQRINHSQFPRHRAMQSESRWTEPWYPEGYNSNDIDMIRVVGQTSIRPTHHMPSNIVRESTLHQSKHEALYVGRDGGCHFRPPPSTTSYANIMLMTPPPAIGGRTGVPGVSYAPIPAESNHRDPCHTPGEETAWVFDSGAGVAGFYDRHGLDQFTSFDRGVVIGGIVDDATITVTQGALLDNVKVLFSPKFTANCIPSSAAVDAGWQVRYHPATDTYLVKTVSGHKLCFQRYKLANGWVTTHYLCHPRLPYTGPTCHPGTDANVLATSVQGNLAMHTPQDAKAAAIAHRYLTNMGGSIQHGISRLPLLKGVDITVDQIRKAEKIFGPVRSHVQGSATSVQDTVITSELPKARPVPVPQSLAIDLCKILGSWFVLGVFLPCHYLALVEVVDHSAPIILTAVKTLVESAERRNFDVMKIQSDGEEGIHSQQMNEYCASKHIHLFKTGAGQHEVFAERLIRATKAEVRNIAARVVPNSLPRRLIVHMVLAAATSINCRLTTALTGSQSPNQIWHGETQQHAQDLDFIYGDLALAKTPNNRNDITPRADTVMILYPTFGTHHGYLAYKLGTGTTVIRTHSTLRHVPWTTADTSHIDKLAKEDPDGVKLPRREHGTDSGGINPSQLVRTNPSLSLASREAAEDLQDPSSTDPISEEKWVTEHPEVGQRVAGMFKGKLFGGVVDKVLLEHTGRDGDFNKTAYHVSYDDGDQADLDGDEELQSAKELARNPQSAPRTTRIHLLSHEQLRLAKDLASDATVRTHNAPPRTTNPPDVFIHKLSVAKAMREQPVETAAAVRAELQQMLTLGVFEPVLTSTLTDTQRKRIIRSSMFMKHKYSPSGDYLKTKARLVAGGDLQDKSLYSNISSPTATPTSVLFVCGDAAAKGKAVASMDIGGAYLNASMASTGIQVEMIIEPRLATVLADLDPTYHPYLRRDGSVCVRLIKALYGTVEAAKLWYDHITGILHGRGFVSNPYDKCVLNKIMPDGTTITIVLYVDDLLVTCVNLDHIRDLQTFLMSKFPEVSFHAGEVVEYVGMTIDFRSKPKAAVVTMKQMTDDIIVTSMLKQYKTHSPAADALFDVEESALIKDAEYAFFRTFVAKLLYLAKRARPDILLTVSFLATRAQTPTSHDLHKLHRVISYVQNTSDRGIVIEFGADFRARAFVDAAYAIHQKDKKSHTGASLVFGTGGPLYVTSVKQSIVTKSSTEAELIAASDVASELLCLRNFAIAQGYPNVPAVLYQDNMSTMALINNGGPCSKRSRHIDIRYFWLHEKITDGSLVVEHCPTETMWANVLTKPLQGAQFDTERDGLTNWK